MNIIRHYHVYIEDENCGRVCVTKPTPVLQRSEVSDGGVRCTRIARWVNPDGTLADSGAGPDNPVWKEDGAVASTANSARLERKFIQALIEANGLKPS